MWIGHTGERGIMIDNTAWLAGYAAYVRGDGCPWGDESARAGWIAARWETRVRVWDLPTSTV